MNRNQIGTEGLLTASAIAMILAVVSMLVFPPLQNIAPHGMALPSPEGWINHFPSDWIVNMVLIFAVGIGMMFCNKEYNFVQGNSMVFPMAFLVLAAGNPYITTHLCSSTLLLCFNAVSLSILFSAYRKPNATQEYFVIATFLALGAMTQYAFLAMIPAMLICGVILKSLHLREVAAFILGLVAPYWVGLGLGQLSPADFHLPSPSPLFTGFESPGGMLIMLIGAGLAFLVSALISLDNAVRLYAGNSRIRHFANAFNVLGYTCFICILIDFGNLTAYLGTLYLWMALQIGNLYSLHRMRHPRLLLWIMALLSVIPLLLQINRIIIG